MRIALFDIDGTLLASGGAGRRAMETALMEVFGSIGPAGYAYDGKTDRQIVRELMRADGRTDAEIEAGMPHVFARYLAELDVEKSAQAIRALPGVEAVLDALEPRDDVVLGLLTGNVIDGARVKLGAAAIDIERFVLGAYGSDHELRPELPRIARERAIAALARDVPRDALVVIGDTPLDIACAHAQGARALAVATGRFSMDELAAHAPAAVLASMADVDTTVRTILEC
ncbi:MAG: haloacid dehalogenase-like hydrolase [Gemmatimonadaceae bacterium]|nr:haloacid dehalogenase-like hydrolase [Gemmatimonadaceae bacterium]